MNTFDFICLIIRFVWSKKIERDVSQGVPLDMFSVKAEKKRQRERMVRILLQVCFTECYSHFDAFIFIMILKPLVVFVKTFYGGD